MKTLLFVAAALIALATPAKAQSWEDGYWIKKSIRSSCEWWETCPRYRHVYSWVRRHNHQERYNRSSREYDSYRNLERCKPAVRVWGDQAQSEENAKSRAVTSFAGAVRFQYGEVYINFALAEDVKILCSPSSVSDTVTSKVQERVFGTEYFRCEVQARPCRPKRKED